MAPAHTQPPPAVAPTISASDQARAAQQTRAMQLGSTASTSRPVSALPSLATQLDGLQTALRDANAWQRMYPAIPQFAWRFWKCIVQALRRV